MLTKKIVVTGGPSTGKTVVVRNLEEQGYTCLHEVIRDMTQEQKIEENSTGFVSNPIVSVSDPEAFNSNLLKARVSQFESVENLNSELVFFDRGIPDVLAYMDCFGQSYDSKFTNAALENRYDIVFIMPPWKEIHVRDGERFESFEESLRIDKALTKSYLTFGYNVQVVPKVSILDRVQFILEHVKENS